MGRKVAIFCPHGLMRLVKSRLRFNFIKASNELCLHLTRRQFHLTLMASLATTALPRPAQAAPAPDLWLNRVTFGATAAGRAAFPGPIAWLDDQLSHPADDPALTARLTSARLRIAHEAGSDQNDHIWPAKDKLRSLASLTSDPATQLYCIDWEQVDCRRL